MLTVLDLARHRANLRLQSARSAVAAGEPIVDAIRAQCALFGLILIDPNAKPTPLALERNDDGVLVPLTIATACE